MTASVPPLLLASTSRFRRALLDRMGLPYEAVAPDFDEITVPGLSPLATASLFAREKALAVARLRPDALVLGGDQTVDLEGRMLRKPHDLDEAAGQLLQLAGRWHHLHSAVAVVGPTPDVVREAVVTVSLRMRALTPEQARRYVAADQPHGSAGGYLYELRGFLLFDEVRGSDDSAIVGLPLGALGRLLRDAGVDPLA